MNDFSRRLWPSLLSVGLVVLLLCIAWQPILQYVVAVIVAFMGSVAAWEYGQLAKAKGVQLALFPLLFFTFCEIYAFFESAHDPIFCHLPIWVFVLALLFIFAHHFRKKEGAILDIAAGSFALLYIAVPIGMLLGILYLHVGGDGRWWLAYLLSVTKVTDMAAYVTGGLLGKTKLAPQISPHKTIAGAVGGLIAACAVSYLFYHLSPSLFSSHSWEWLVLGAALSIGGQFGDLAESLLKRDADKKDSNNVPGLGGVLDALDSLLFNAPILYCYLYCWK